MKNKHIITILVILFGILFCLGFCDPVANKTKDDIANNKAEGKWLEVDPTPDMPDGTRCWAFYRPDVDIRDINPVCKFP